jgi:hypothetical protein
VALKLKALAPTTPLPVGLTLPSADASVTLFATIGVSAFAATTATGDWTVSEVSFSDRGRTSGQFSAAFTGDDLSFGVEGDVNLPLLQLPPAN